jgi:hypothetical protein
MKLGIINAFTLGLSFTAVEQWLKITLLIISIIYTIMKIKEIDNTKK